MPVTDTGHVQLWSWHVRDMQFARSRSSWHVHVPACTATDISGMHVTGSLHAHILAFDTSNAALAVMGTLPKSTAARCVSLTPNGTVSALQMFTQVRQHARKKGRLGYSLLI